MNLPGDKQQPFDAKNGSTEEPKKTWSATMSQRLDKSLFRYVLPFTVATVFGMLIMHISEETSRLGVAFGRAMTACSPAIAVSLTLRELIALHGKAKSPWDIGYKGFTSVVVVIVMVGLANVLMSIISGPGTIGLSRLAPGQVLMVYLVWIGVLGPVFFALGALAGALFVTFDVEPDPVTGKSSETQFSFYSRQKTAYTRVSYFPQTGRAVLSRRDRASGPWVISSERIWQSDMLLHDARKQADDWMAENQ